MNALSRRLILAALALCSLPAAPATDEAALRDAMVHYERAWNQRDVAAWKDLVTTDLLYQETYLHTDEARQMNTRERSLRAFQSGIDAFDFKWEPLRIYMKPDGSATAVMRVVQLALPRSNGKYAATFETNPAIARWRVVDGRWQLYHYVTYKGLAQEIVRAEGL
jgi:hypothetical protein